MQCDRLMLMVGDRKSGSAGMPRPISYSLSHLALHSCPTRRSSDLVTQFCRKLAAERPLKDIRDEYNYPKKKGIKDECSRLLEASTMKSRRGFAIQRLMNAMRQAHADGW